MGLGLSKSFVIFLILALVVGFGLHDWVSAMWIFGTYLAVKIVWNILTG